MRRGIVVLLICASFFTLYQDVYAQNDNDVVRKPVVSGTFYPSNPDKLRNMLEDFLSKAVLNITDKAPVAIIVPHAGYQYSAPVAAYSYDLIRGKKYDAIVILAPSHHFRFGGVSVYHIGDYQTPLGFTKVDRELCEELISKDPIIGFHQEAHRKEHSLEVQIPFLQIVQPGTPIIPVVIGNQSYETAKILSKALLDISKNRRILFVISTDLSHYHPYKDACAMDLDTVQYIKEIQWGELFVRTMHRKNEMCGFAGVLTSLLIADKMGIKQAKILKYANSGDTTGDKSSVVGYAAIAFTKPKEEVVNEFTLNKEQEEKLLRIARDSINNYIGTGKIPKFSESDSLLNVHAGAFVTLKKQGRLRGCIGQFIVDKPLYKVVSEMAIAAAVKDTRFKPVEEDELKDIDIHISVLSPLKKVDSIDDVQLGKNGIYIRQGFRSGTFLPEVALEAGWEKEEFIEHCLVDKAGLPVDALKNGAELYIYTTYSFSEK